MLFAAVGVFVVFFIVVVVVVAKSNVKHRKFTALDYVAPRRPRFKRLRRWVHCGGVAPER